MSALRKPAYKIFGNTFEQRAIGARGNVLVKRYIVSTEFVQLFYRCLDGDFDIELYREMNDNEKFLLSKMVIYMKLPENRKLNIEVSKFMKTLFERLRLIEGAVKAGNLSTQLQDEYCTIIDKLVSAGVLRQHHGSYQKTVMRQTQTQT